MPSSWPCFSLRRVRRKTVMLGNPADADKMVKEDKN
jgi:hypothetical protein